MGPSMVDGFLCAVLSGPNLIMPGEVMRWIWDAEEGETDPPFKDQAEGEEIVGLIMKQWNAIVQALMNAPRDYAPHIYAFEFEGREVPVIDDWCAGYYLGMTLDMKTWAPLWLGQPDLLTPVLLYGTEDGRSTLKKMSFSPEQHNAMAKSLSEMARNANAFWMVQREQEAADGHIREPIRRNDPCPCGSGRKHKKCHGAN